MRVEKKKSYLIKILLYLFLLVPILGYVRILCASSHVDGTILAWATGYKGSYSDREDHYIRNDNSTDPDSDHEEKIIMSDVYGNLVGFDGYITNSLEAKYKDSLCDQRYFPLSGLGSLDLNRAGKNLKTTLLPAESLENIRLKFNRKIAANISLVAAYNYETGEVLIALSLPSKARDDQKAASGTYVNYVISGNIVPGSTMKILATAAALSQNPSLADDFTYTCTGSKVLSDGTEIKCAYIHKGPLKLSDVLGMSCNCAIATIVEQLDVKETQSFFQNLGYSVNGSEADRRLVSKLSCSTSRITFESNERFNDIWGLVGQGKTIMNPLDLCMFAGAVANEGVVAEPYIVSEIRSRDLSITYESVTPKTTRLLSAKTANLLKEVWKDGVDTYYGKYKLNSAITYAKTGTIQTDNEAKCSRSLLGVMEEQKISFFIYAEKVGASSTVCYEVADSLLKEIMEHGLSYTD